MSDTENLDYAAGWRPEEGDVLTGNVVELSVGHGQWGQYPIVIIRPEDGSADVAVHAFHHSLRNRLLELKPKQGERIGIQYKGQRPSKSKPGQTVAIYIVRIAGRTADSAWENLQPAGEPAQPAAQTRLPMNPQEIQDTQEQAFDTEDFAPTPQNATDDDIPF